MKAGKGGDFLALRAATQQHLEAGRYAEAVAEAGRALALRPGAWGVLGMRGDALAALGRNEQALADYARSLALQPGQARLLFNRGRLLQKLRRQREALASYDRSLALKPDNPGALLNRGNALRALNRIEEAIESFRRALEFNPRYAQAHSNLGNALQALGRYDEAVGCYRAALEAKPDYVDALNNIGNAMQMLGRYPEAIEFYDRVLAQQPELAASLWNKGTTMLHLGLSREAWLLYEHRLDSDLYDRLDTALPALGETPIDGQRLLVQWEARFGDVIQMLRYVPALQAGSAGCQLQMAGSLRELAARSFPGTPIIDVKDTAEADYRVPYTSLPLALRTFSERDIPASVPYLKPDPAKAARWAGVLGRRIGITWRGNPVPAHRLIPFEALRPVFAIPGLRFVTLQKNLTTEERHALSSMPQVAILDEELETFDDTAAVVAGLDLVISVDSAVAHLAGALARPVWVLLKVGADWRWMSERDDSRWYPTARLFRQETLGEWPPVVDKVVQALVREFG